jgi:uncharacterized membrane protein
MCAGAERLGPARGEAGSVRDNPARSRRGRALHPPFTDFPIAAYVFAAAFDIGSAAGGPHRGWATELWHAGTFVLVGGLCVCLLTMLTGFLDLLSVPGRYPGGVTRTVLVHIGVMSAVFVIGSADTAWRITEYHRQASTPVAILVLSVAAAVGICVGGAYGGTLVFRFGVGVRAAGPGPVPARAALPGAPVQAARHRLRRGQAVRPPRP